jgi:hypothetical protein
MLKKILLVSSFLLSLCISAKAQALSLDKLLVISNEGVSSANNILIAKGWIFKGEQNHVLSDAECNFPELQWAFAPSDYNPDKASGYVTLFKSDSCAIHVMYQTFEKADFDKIKATITKYGIKHSDTQVIKDLSGSRSGVRDTYEGKNYVVEQIVSSSTGENGNLINEYYFTIHQKS